ncbi:AAT family amino acid transporter, variant [Aspergillus uvarum CBS 121591]|uniref:AAT family amino acid transporter, variant n=1 Tax=Aspergillus uvarum CBS 121591 TaxID=1448315 RepID=A0A319D1Y9_9EURO|nr:AAT family amino acid transporter, variant [Aspergillus uvarum CBS 121591]PYH81908.1 AAT family amino acid transporter, variant [Aspergillus uvarum CBS 121591]
MVPPKSDVQEGQLVSFADSGLKRELSERQISMLSLASIIGGPAFYLIGYVIHLSGPIGTLLAFCLVGFIVWALMQSLGEVTTMFPIAGGFIEHATRFVDPSFGFALAWIYYLMWCVLLATEWSGAILVLNYWITPEQMPIWGWCLVFFGFFTVLTNCGVVVYGEIEYWLGWAKLFAIFACFFVSFLVNVGAFGNGYVGFRYWTPPNGPFQGGIGGFAQSLVTGAAFYVGTEILSLAAAETQQPQRAIPRGTRSVVIRICVVFIGLAFWQSIICPATSPQLLQADSTVGTSPFTIAFTQVGWVSSGDFINALCTMAFISGVNGAVYVQSRVLYSMALTGRAPRVFARLSKAKVPYVAIVAANMWGFLTLLNLGGSAGAIYSYIVTVAGSCAYITWACIVFTHLRVRGGLVRQGIDLDTIPFRAAGSIWIYRCNFVLVIFLLLISGYTTLVPFDRAGFVSSYISIPTFFICYLGHKLYHRSQW